jgi:hypothetical protein
MMKTIDFVISDLCKEIDYLKDELDRTREDVRFYREAYNKLLTDNISSGEEMMSSILKALVKEC